jgi:Sulfotransferase domain
MSAGSSAGDAVTTGVTPPGGFVFVVSHMRSYSTLLCHILGSHPEISGYAEAHQAYASAADFDALINKVRAATEQSTLRRYVLDKILHNHLPLAPEILSKPEVKVVFLVRSAEETITSLLNLLRAMGRQGDPQQALDYYLSRLRQIDAYSEQLGRKALLIDGEELIANTAPTLEGLSQWLALNEPLSPNYQLFKFTGAPGYGDISPAVRTGKVVHEAAARHRRYKTISIPQDVLERGNAGHSELWARLAARSHLLSRDE